MITLLARAILAVPRGVSAGMVEGRAAFHRGSARRAHLGDGRRPFVLVYPQAVELWSRPPAPAHFREDEEPACEDHLSVFSGLGPVRQLNSTSLPKRRLKGMISLLQRN